MEGEFSVAQFFDDGTHEYVRRWVDKDEAVKAAVHYTRSVAVMMRMVNRVIITDAGDSIVFEWILDKGVIFPPTGENNASENA